MDNVHILSLNDLGLQTVVWSICDTRVYAAFVPCSL